MPLFIVRKTVTVLSHCSKRAMTLTQNCLLGARFDVSVQPHNDALEKHINPMRWQIDFAGRERHLPMAAHCAVGGIGSTVPKKG
jgi:hypothetical protein